MPSSTESFIQAAAVTRRNAEEIHGVAFRRNPIDVHGSKQFGEYSYCVARPNVLHGRTTGRKLRQAPVRLFRVRYRSKKGRSCAEKAIRVCEPAANLLRVRPDDPVSCIKKRAKIPTAADFAYICFITTKYKSIWKNYSNRSTIASQTFRRMHIFSGSKATRQPDGGLVKPHWS